MLIKSENIKKYIENNLSIKNNEIEMDEIIKLEKININGLNYKLEKAVFVPEELSYLKGISECSFKNFTITNEILENLNKLDKLNVLQFDFCQNETHKTINNKINSIYLNGSNFELLSMCENTEYMETIFLKNIEKVDINSICKYKNLKKLFLLNSDIKNIELLEELPNLSYLKIIGSKIDNLEIIEKLRKKIEVIYSEEEYFNIG